MLSAALVAIAGSSTTEPRVIKQFTSLFLVGHGGAIWRVYDCASRNGARRCMPSRESEGNYRLFLSLGSTSQVRAYTLTADCSRAVDAESLQRQLDLAVPIGM